MNQQNNINVKLSDLQLDKSKLTIKNSTAPYYCQIWSKFLLMKLIFHINHYYR